MRSNPRRWRYLWATVPNLDFNGDWQLERKGAENENQTDLKIEYIDIVDKFMRNRYG